MPSALNLIDVIGQIALVVYVTTFYWVIRTVRKQHLQEVQNAVTNPFWPNINLQFIPWAYKTYAKIKGSIVLPAIPHETVTRIKSISEYLSKPHLAISSIIGCFLSVLAGFVCSRIARTETMKLAYIMATISFIVGSALSYSTYPISLIIVFSITSYALLIIGYGLGQQANSSR